MSDYLVEDGFIVLKTLTDEKLSIVYSYFLYYDWEISRIEREVISVGRIDSINLLDLFAAFDGITINIIDRSIDFDDFCPSSEKVIYRKYGEEFYSSGISYNLLDESDRKIVLKSIEDYVIKYKYFFYYTDIENNKTSLLDKLRYDKFMIHPYSYCWNELVDKWNRTGNSVNKRDIFSEEM